MNKNIITIFMVTIALGITLVIMIAGAIYNTVRYGIEVFKNN
jgi:hypothetical protein